MKGISAFVGVILVASTANCTPASPEEAVDKKFDAYMNAWINHDIGGVWKATSPRIREDGGGSKEDFKKFIIAQNVYPAHFKRVETQVNGDRASVIADVALTDAAKTETLEEREKCELVLQNGSWYVDDCKPLHPPRLTARDRCPFRQV